MRFCIMSIMSLALAMYWASINSAGQSSDAIDAHVAAARQAVGSLEGRKRDAEAVRDRVGRRAALDLQMRQIPVQQPDEVRREVALTPGPSPNAGGGEQ